MAIQVMIIGILHYVIPFLKRLEIFASHHSSKFGLTSALPDPTLVHTTNVFINSVLWNLKFWNSVLLFWIWSWPFYLELVLMVKIRSINQDLNEENLVKHGILIRSRRERGVEISKINNVETSVRNFRVYFNIPLTYSIVSGLQYNK